METAIQPLTEYLRCFSRYTELILLDEEKWASTVKFRAELYLKMGQMLRRTKVPPAIPRKLKGLVVFP